jgi:hypothetical protein
MPLLDGALPRLGNKKLSTIQIDNFGGGSNKLFSETRLKKDEAKEATNLLLIEDGIWDKRWGTAQYAGVSWTADIDGFSEYRKTNGDRELIVVADGKVWLVDPETQSKTEILGATFTSGEMVYFLQINSLLYISNGVDPLARYNGTSLAVYSEITSPVNVSATRGAGLSAGSITMYYRVSAVNAVGETTGSTEVSVAVNQERDVWVVANSANVALDWPDVSGALKYVIYWADTSGFETKIAEVNTSSYTDTGADVANPYVEPRADNTTGGPMFGPMWISGNRIWGTGDPDNPWRAYGSGTGVNLGNFSPAYGGFWIDLEKGGRAVTTLGFDFQGKSHVACETPEGRGQVWQVTLETQTIGESSFIVPIPTKIIASTGTNAPRGGVYVENDFFMPNPRGINVFGNEPGVLNVLRTAETSAKIRPYWRGLMMAYLNKVCSYYYDAKVFVSVPYASEKNDRIIVFDRERSAWIQDWTIGVSQFGEHTDNDGITHFLGAKDNKLIEISENYQGDSGVAFTWRYTSPRIPVNKDWTKFEKIKKVFIRLRNPVGTINFSVLGTGKNKQFSSLKTAPISQGSSDTGMGWDPIGTVMIGDTEGAPTTFAQESLIRYVNVNKLVREIQFDVSGSSMESRAAITGILATGFLLSSAPPSDWKITS